MITGTSGVSGLTGGNCSREEYDHYQRLEGIMSERISTYTYPVRDHWVTGLHPFDNIAAELQIVADRMRYVLLHAGPTMGPCELHELDQAAIELDELLSALRS